MASGDRPDVSVVIASVGRETRLAFLLEALQEQSLSRERFEVIVVRGCEPDDPAGDVEALGARLIECAPAASGELRNRGVAEARAPLVAFTDDDCRPAPDWLERLVEAAGREHGDFVLQGRTEPDPDEVRRLHGLARTQKIVGPSPWYQACNIAYPRELFDRLGGFDDAFADHAIGGEDADLGLRAVESGARRVYVDGAVVWHAVHSRHLSQALRDTRRWESVPLILASHPHHRRALQAGLFGRAAHWKVLLALLGLSLRRRPLVAVALATPYLAHYSRGYPRTRRGLARALLDLPARSLVDLAEVAVTAEAGVRHRAPAL